MDKKRGKLRLGLIQTAVSADVAANRRKTLAKARHAAEKGAKVICLQELYETLYFPQEKRRDSRHLAETIPGESTNAFSALAREFGAVVIVPLFEKASDGKPYNSAVVIDADGTLLPTYRKVHIPHDPLFWEKNYFEPGDRGFKVYKTKHASVAAMICYDQWFPEAARINTLSGADILFYPTAIGRIQGYRPPEGDWLEAWVTMQRSHAIANGVHVAAVNRVGREGKLKFWGNSFVCDAFGKILKRGGETESTLVVDVDLSQNQRIREGWGFLRNRRPDSYSVLAKA